MTSNAHPAREGSGAPSGPAIAAATVAALALSLGFGTPGSARAQTPAAVPPTAPAAAPETTTTAPGGPGQGLPTVALATPPADRIAARRAGDAAADRGILLPSAEIGPAGEITFNSYELVLAGLTYGVTDRAQVSLTVLLPVVKDMPLLVSTSLKYVLSRSESTVVSVMPTLFVLRESTDDLFIGSVGSGLLADRVLDRAGRIVLSGAFFMHTGFGSAGTDPNFQVAEGVVFYGSAALSGRVGRHVKLLGELILPGGYTWAGPNRFEIVEQALLFGYGIRFFGASIGVDLAFLRPLHPDADTGPLLMGVPWLAFSGRF